MKQHRRSGSSEGGWGSVGVRDGQGGFVVGRGFWLAWA